MKVASFSPGTYHWNNRKKNNYCFFCYLFSVFVFFFTLSCCCCFSSKHQVNSFQVPHSFFFIMFVCLVMVGLLCCVVCVLWRVFFLVCFFFVFLNVFKKKGLKHHRNTGSSRRAISINATCRVSEQRGSNEEGGGRGG